MDKFKVLSHLKKPTFNFFLIILFLTPAVASFYFGLQPHIISSGSMRPHINPGDVVLTKPEKVAVISTGEVILLFDNGLKSLEAHRVVEIVRRIDESIITTKGDSNPNKDPVLTQPSNLPLQKVVFVLPNAGYLLEITRSDSAKYLVGAMILILIMARSILKSRKKNKDSKDKFTDNPRESVEEL